LFLFHPSPDRAQRIRLAEIRMIRKLGDAAADFSLPLIYDLQSSIFNPCIRHFPVMGNSNKKLPKMGSRDEREEARMRGGRVQRPHATQLHRTAFGAHLPWWAVPWVQVSTT
jgi:hypothetical protein